MPKHKGNKLLSIVIPAYKQEKTIAKDLGRIRSVLEKIRYDYEMIVVVDGKTDKTFEKAKKVRSPKIKVIGYQTNKGKGHAVRYGMVRSQGDIIGFIDAGMDLDPNSLSMLLEHFEWYDADIIVGSKRHPVSAVKGYNWQRRLVSWGGQMITRFLLGIKVRDTQAGVKFFRRKVLKDIMPRLLVKKFAFDIEMLAVAKRLGYKRIFEAPVRMEWTLGNSVISRSFWRSAFKVLWDTLAVFYRLKILGYYDNLNKGKWEIDKDLDFRIRTG